MKLIIASNNKGKIREYKDIFEPFGFQVYSQSEENICLEVEETGTTFEENAAVKARAIYGISHCCVISDDSGLEVEALGGEPGLFSARYKGLETEHERRLAVLKGLEGSDNRKARFVTCICFIDEAGEEHLFSGVWNGELPSKKKAQMVLATTRSSFLKMETERQQPAFRSRLRRHTPTGQKPFAS